MPGLTRQAAVKSAVNKGSDICIKSSDTLDVTSTFTQTVVLLRLKHRTILLAGIRHTLGGGGGVFI